MALQTVASRYAKSLLELCLEQNSLDSTLTDLETFEAALESKELMYLVKSPIVKSEKKLSIYKEIFEGKMGKLSNSFFELLFKKGREAHIQVIIEEFRSQVNAHRGISSVTLTSASPIGDEVLAKIKQGLAESSETLAEIKVETVIDPSLIGGFKLNIGDKLYDASVAHKLERLRKEFAQ